MGDTPALSGCQYVSKKLWHYKAVLRRMPLKALNFFYGILGWFR
jgi:hypothetical protein